MDGAEKKSVIWYRCIKKMQTSSLSIQKIVTEKLKNSVISKILKKLRSADV